ncbi:MAG TPA: efflux RND transporter permease subunit, partial [Terriglobia bacterium]|nr:efflux RND transporter permease subunit [Terriglobia bacterium]
ERQQELAESASQGGPPGSGLPPESGFAEVRGPVLRATPAPAIGRRERGKLLMNAARQVGPPIFFSLIIIVVSFLPVFLLEAQEGRMFRPLAWTKTLAISFSSILAITLIPILMLIFIRGKLRPESANPVSRFTQFLYLPVLRFCLRHRLLAVAASLVFLAITLPLATRIGSQFMPSFYEGDSVYMPTAYPGISITQASNLMQEQDRIIKSFPEVRTVFGTIGRSDSATDNAPLSMYDTTIVLKPKSEWPAGMTYSKLVQKMDARLQFPGLTNTWTMPIQNRLDMELTGIKTPVGLKIQGPNVADIQQAGERIESLLSGLEGVRSVFAERVSQGFYVNVRVDRPQAARYGLTVADVQRAVTSGIGGENIAVNIQGRERYPVNVRYHHDFRDNLDALGRVLLATPTGAQVPIKEVAALSYSRGPAMIRDEDAQLTGYVYVDLSSSDYGGFVEKADALLQQKLRLPAGVSYQWSGEYEFEVRAKKRLEMIMPMVFIVIFLLLYMVFNSVAEAAILIFPTAFALTGGLLLQWILHYNFSVAVWVGYIALFGIAVETGVVMVVYLHEALDKRLAHQTPLDNQDIYQATMDGAVLRLRPKLMTVCAVLASLIPILWESGAGSDIMKPIATPIVGGMITSSIAVLVLLPVLFMTLKERQLRHGTLRGSQDRDNEEID